jgi:hypothetical protein
MKKSLLVVLLGVGLLAAPTFGTITAQITVDDPVIGLGETTTGYLWVGAVGQTQGIQSVSVTLDVAPGGVISLSDVAFQAPLTDDLPQYLGTPLPDGGLDDVAAADSVFSPTTDWATDAMQVALTFTVSGDGLGLATINVLNDNDPSGYLGIVDYGFNAGDNADYTGATVEVVPEPASLALLALGGIAAIRRRK